MIPVIRSGDMGCAHQRRVGIKSDIYVYFNNDTLGCALRDARAFAREADRAGLQPTRVPLNPIAVD
jgi:hypothetical protein